MRNTNEIAAKLNRGMTVDMLIEALKELPGDAVPGFEVNYGDRSRTRQFLPVGEVTLMVEDVIDTTAYSESGLCVRAVRDEEEILDDSGPKVVILSM